MEVTFFPDQWAKSQHRESLTLAELRDLIQNTSEPTKNKLPWLKLATFGTKRSEKNCLRYNANVLSITGIELDYDREEMTLDDAIEIAERAQLRALLYTSARYSDAAPRWRILLPTSKPLPTAERAKLVARVNGLYGGVFSPESFTLSQSYYFGSVNNNPAHRAVLTEGDCIDLRDDLDAKALGKNGKGTPPEMDGAYADPYSEFGRSHPERPPPLAKVAAALDVIPNDDAVDRAQWVRIGMSIKSAYPGDEGLALFKQWSETWTGGECREQYTVEKWKSFQPSTITIGTLFFYAAEIAGEDWWERAQVGDDDEPPAKSEGKKLPEPAEVELQQCSLADVHQVFRKWLGDEYDLDAIDAVAAAAASERLTGDPLWLLIISGPGAAKTETVQALAGAGAYVTSTIASEGALLSGTAKKSRAKNATGGLLRKIGERGLLVIKDVTSILSSDRNIRGTVLAAIREIYDGRWERNVGTDGGQTMTWVGRIIIIGAVTTAWDSAHAVVAAMGDRFVSLRIDSSLGRVQSGTRAMCNTGVETEMREELAAAVGGLIAHASTDEAKLSDSEIEQLLKAADIVTFARTAVERDYRGEVAYGHAPEMPTRFAKQLTQMVRGGVAIGMAREQAMKLAIRCARDSIPPLRLEILLDIAMNPGSDVTGVRKRITKPWTTVKRELEGLQMLGLLLCEEEDVEPEEEGAKAKTKWLYSLAPDFDRKTLLDMAGVVEFPAFYDDPYSEFGRAD